jgi:hypothetical protein
MATLSGRPRRRRTVDGATGMGHAETRKQHKIHVITRAHRHINALQARLVQPRF